RLCSCAARRRCRRVRCCSRSRAGLLRMPASSKSPGCCCPRVRPPCGRGLPSRRSRAAPRPPCLPLLRNARAFSSSTASTAFATPLPAALAELPRLRDTGGAASVGGPAAAAPFGHGLRGDLPPPRAHPPRPPRTLGVPAGAGTAPPFIPSPLGVAGVDLDAAAP